MTTQDSRQYMEDMFDMTDDSDSIKEPSEIAQFFSGCNVLITGGSGFIGKLLIEKMLRCCPDISTLFILMRAKKGKTPAERFEEHFKDTIYDRLKKEREGSLKKIVMIEGNTEDEDLGLSPQNRERLLCTNIIIHAAATVRFDEKLRVASNINVRGTKQMLLFAREMPNFKAFVHVSTAFCYCVYDTIEEKHYKPPIDTDGLLTIVDTLDDDKLESITPALIGKWPNTYTFTKAIAEHTVLKYGRGIPVSIVRPSIVIATYQEPLAGWINNLYGPTGVVVGAAVGLLRTLHCIPERIADIIPADYVISNIISAAWYTGVPKNSLASSTESDQDSDIPDTERIPVYNCVTSCQKPLSWGEYMKFNEICAKDVASRKVIWHYMFKLNRYLTVHYIYVVLLHLVPAVIADAIAYCIGRKAILLKAYKKIHKFSDVISYFSTREWKFYNDANMKLWDKLNSTDRKIFHFNVDSLDWIEFFYYHIRGIRIYLVDDSMETIEAGRAKMFKLKVAHYTLVTIIWLLLLWGIWSCLVYFLGK